MFPFMVASAAAASQLASTHRYILAHWWSMTKHACSWGGPGEMQWGRLGRRIVTVFAATLIGCHTVRVQQWKLPHLPWP